MDLKQPKPNEAQRKLEVQRKLEEQEKKRARALARQQAKPPVPLHIQQAVTAFLPQIPALMSARTNQVKQKSGRHCKLIELQKYARELLKSKYNISFESLPLAYKSNIYSTIANAYYSMRDARQNE